MICYKKFNNSNCYLSSDYILLWVTRALSIVEFVYDGLWTNGTHYRDMGYDKSGKLIKLFSSLFLASIKNCMRKDLSLQWETQ